MIEGVNRALATSAVIALVAVAADVHADTTTIVERREVPVMSTSNALVAGGTITASLGYGVAAVLAVSSTYGADRLLFVPVAGPWIDLGLRPPGTKEENWARVGLVVDGVAQLAGVVMLVAGLVMKQHAPRAVAALVTPTGGGVSLSF